MTDDRDLNESYVRTRMLGYADVALGQVAADHREIARRAGDPSTPVVPLSGLLVVLVIVSAVALLARASVTNPGTDIDRAPAASCADGDWPVTDIPCDTAVRIGNQAGARVDRARIWLTTLGAVKTALHPVQQVSEPAETAEVWVIVYDGFWRCCPNAFDENGRLIPQIDQTRWLVVAEAAKEGTGSIYLQDWTGRPVPDLLPKADGAVTCSTWTDMTDGQRVDLADRLVGDSDDLLDQVRIRQHQSVGTSRDLLIVDVAQSLTKMCDGWAPGSRPVIEVFEALYVK